MVDWQFLFAELFDPQRPLRDEDLRFYVGRDDSPSREILRYLEEEPAKAFKFFLSGSPGSGKSSELAELGRVLDQDRMVVGLDIYQSAANVAQVTGGEVLFMMGLAACRVAIERWGHQVDQRVQDGLVEAFRGMAREPERIDIQRLLKGTAVFSAGLATSAAGVAGAVIGPVTTGLADIASAILPRSVAPRPFGGLAKELREGDPEVERMADALNAVLDDIGSRLRKPVILVDGLDRIEEPGSIRQLFLQTRLLDLPAFPVVYNGPISLWLSPDYGALTSTARFKSCPLPNFPVERPVGSSAALDDGELQRSRAHLRRIVELRLASQEWTVDQAFDPGAIDLVLDWSGGVVRDLVHLVHRACRFAHRRTPRPSRIDRELVELAFRSLAGEIQPGVANAARIEELEQVEKHGRPSGTAESVNLLLRGAVVAYHDHTPWFRVHPFVRPLLG
jgi:hypothetical protein